MQKKRKNKRKPTLLLMIFRENDELSRFTCHGNISEPRAHRHAERNEILNKERERASERAR
jgi:hypothetical protein